MTENRRRSSRFKLEVEVTARTESHFFLAETKDLSEGGVFVATQELKPIGSQVELEIRLPTRGYPIWTQGVVRWIRKTTATAGDAPPLGMGIQFMMISKESQTAIREFLFSRPALVPDQETP